MRRAFAPALAAALSFGALEVPVAAHSSPSYATQDESLRGTIVGFDGKYGLSVRDRRGFLDRVLLHDGTIINPTGLRLSTGMRVTVYGRTNGAAFEANEIDTPYNISPPPYIYAIPAYPPYPYYGFYGGPYWHPY